MVELAVTLPDVAGYLIRGVHSKEETTPRPHGIHGYQPDMEQMRTVFYATGPGNLPLIILTG